MNIDTTSKSHVLDFQAVGIMPKILALLKQRNITVPTPIQHQAIPQAIEGRDLIGIAQTGTGKTFAFGLPMLQRLANGKRRALIVLPTRELAYQVDESLRPYASELGIRMAVVVGGVSFNKQRTMIKQNPRVLIATPGRLNDHLDKGTITLKEVDILVLDEADRMLDMGFKPQIDQVLSLTPRKRQTLLFSATMPQEIVTLAQKEMQMPLRIEVAPEGTTAEKVEQEIIIVKQADKKTLLKALLQETDGQILVFTRTKYGAKNLTRNLKASGAKAAEIHSNRTLPQRKDALKGFKNGNYRILVATDIAARGIDVTDIRLVVNYDLPDDPADYVHRIGRTGRANRQGKAVSFATPTQAKDIKAIEKTIRMPINKAGHESIPSTSLDQITETTKRRSGRGKKPSSHNRTPGNSRKSRNKTRRR